MQSHLSLWVQLKNKYGMHLPVDHLILMLHNILPDLIKEDVKKQKDMRSDLDKQIAHIYSEMGDQVDDKLSRWNLAKMQKQLKLKPKNSTGIHAVSSNGISQPDVAAPSVPDMASIERMINAAVARGQPANRGRQSDRSPAGSRSGSNGSQRGGRGRNIPSPKFAGCWCCGEEGHSRQQCKKFKAIREANGGQVPKNYEGAYEKAQKANRDKAKETPLKAVNVGPAPTNGAAEHAETMPLFPMMKLPSAYESPNKFSALNDGDSDDDEDDVVKALASLTSNVQLASTRALSQKERRAKQPNGARLAHLNAIARKVKSGEINLPDLDLEHDSEYDYIWTMVDSGAGANVARREHFKHSHRVNAPAISLTVANGEVLPNRGARSVSCYDRSGFQKTRVFYEAPVEMPILAVTELAQEGDNGSEVRFRLSDGEIIDTSDGRKVPFVKRMGVYFMKIYFPKDVNGPLSNDKRFVRQDP